MMGFLCELIFLVKRSIDLSDQWLVLFDTVLIWVATIFHPHMLN